MRFSILDCIEQSSLQNANVLAGADNLHRNIKKVTLLETMDSDEIIRYFNEKDQLIITSFLPIKENIEKQCELIKTLAKSNNVGVVIIRVGNIVKELDEKVIKVAETLDFPLISLEGDIKAVDLISEINTKLFYRDKSNLQNKLINNSIFHLLNFEKYEDFQMALRGAAIENDFQAVIVSKDFNPVFSVETRHVTSIADVVAAWRNKKYNISDGIYVRQDINGILTYWGPLVIANEENFLLLVDNNDKYTVEEISKLAEIIEIAGIMWKYTPKKDSKAEIIKALRRNNRNLAYSLNKDAGIDEDQIISVFHMKNIDDKDLEVIVKDFSETEFEVLRLVEENAVYGIILYKEANKKRKEDARKACLEFYNRVKKISNEIRTFQVTGINGIEGAADGYAIINESSHFVQNVYPYKRTFSKYDLILVRTCVAMEIQGATIKKTYLDLLEPLKELGKVKEKQLLETLEIFILDSGLNSNKTAEAMGVHSNTIQYRLRRIEDLLGGDIIENRMISSLTMALAIRRLQKNR